MVVNQTLAEELNGDHPDTVYQFLKAALTDCVAQGAAEYFVAFSSHGGGFLGFGGDENIRRGQRSLAQQQPNDYIVTAMTQALQDVNGAPDFYDVIGFDACLMQAVGVADDYRKIAKYILATEAVKPGHGYPQYRDGLNCWGEFWIAHEGIITVVCLRGHVVEW
jgi:hypothetical protein